MVSPVEAAAMGDCLRDLKANLANEEYVAAFLNDDLPVTKIGSPLYLKMRVEPSSQSEADHLIQPDSWQ